MAPKAQLTHLSAKFVEEMKGKLLAEKKKLEEDMAGLAPHTEIGNDPGENAEEVEIDELNQDLIGRMKNDLEKVDKALTKISEGTYGIDDEGNVISEKRLRVMPWADKAI